MTHEDYMRRALELARRGEGRVDPNPMVGCVVVKDGRILAEGHHERVGGYHAERNALLNCSGDPAGADLYVTLEPCCHHGRTPPCTDIILEKQIARVFVAALDSNPLVAGNGVRILREAGVSVEVGLLEQEARDLNEVFYHFMETGRPFVAMKYAMTLDGKIACASGDSKWITNEASRAYVHALRNRYPAIIAGIGTVLADDPELTCRMEGGRDPLRVIPDTTLRIPADCRIVRTAREVPTLVVTCEDTLASEAGGNKAAALRAAGVEVVPAGTTSVELPKLLETLSERTIDGVLVEGGGTVNASFLEEGLVDRVYAFLGPKLIGGADSKSPVEGTGVPRMADAAELEQIKVERFGEDVLITGRVRKGETPCSQD